MSLRLHPTLRRVRMGTLRRIFHHFRAHLAAERRPLLLAGGATVGGIALELLKPWPIKFIFDYILLDKKGRGTLRPLVHWVRGHQAEALPLLCLGFVSIILLREVFAYRQSLLLIGAGQRVISAIRVQLYTHIQRLSQSFHDASRSGDLLVRLTGDIAMLREMLVTSGITLLGDLLILIGMLVVMACMNRTLTLLSLAVMPLLFLVIFQFSFRIKEASKRQRKQEGEVATVAHETLIGIRAIQAFTRERHEAKRFARQNRKSLQAGLKASQLEAALTRWVQVLIATGTALVLAYGARHVQSHTLTPGDLLVFISYLGSAYKPIRDLAKWINRVAKATACGERVIEVLETRPRITDAPDARPAPRFRGEVVFEGVSFQYEEGKPVLEDVSFAVAPGQVVALVGESGVGKTTIMNLLLRFYDPLRGRILIDGLDIRRYTIESLRRRVAVVFQEPILFGTTVRENIAFGRPKATAAEIEAAAREASADEFVEQLPQGYDTVLGERGVTLSGGQRQRLAIARALLKKAPLLILDEPITGLDAAVEEKVRLALERLTAGKTTFVIAHHFSQISRADKILVLDGGRIVEEGSHAELEAAGARYSCLLGLQRGTFPGSSAPAGAAGGSLPGGVVR